MRNFLARALGVAVGAALFIGALLVSAVVFAVASAVALVLFGAYFWRARRLGRPTRQPFDHRDVIEGTVIPDRREDRPRRE